MAYYALVTCSFYNTPCTPRCDTFYMLDAAVMICKPLTTPLGLLAHPLGLHVPMLGGSRLRIGTVGIGWMGEFPACKHRILPGCLGSELELGTCYLFLSADWGSWIVLLPSLLDSRYYSTLHWVCSPKETPRECAPRKWDNQNLWSHVTLLRSCANDRVVSMYGTDL